MQKIKRILLLATILVTSGVLMGVSQGQKPITLNALFMKQAAYSEDDVKAMTADFEKSNPGINVNIEFAPYEALRDKTIAAHAAGGYDVVLFDVIWPTEYATNGFLLDVTNRIDKSTVGQIFSGAWTTVQHNGKYYGLPWILDTKYLFYNTEILKQAGFKNPPRTYQELMLQAQTIKRKGLVTYPFVSSWSQAEALVADYTMYLSAFKGKFFNEKGQPVFQTGGGLKALEWMAESIKNGVSNPNSNEYLEEDVRRVFSSGQAAFALNWTYMYNLTQDPKESKVVGKVGIVPAPGSIGGAKVSAVNGSMGLGITKGSRHVDAAWQYISHLSSKSIQEKYSKLSLPIWKASYSNPLVTKGQEAVVKAANVSIGAMYPRPTVVKYQEVSTILQISLQNALLLAISPKASLDAAAEKVATLK